MFEKIWSTNLSTYSVEGRTEDPEIRLAKLNLFVGANNSGKSRLLRLLFTSNRNDIKYSERILREGMTDLINKWFPTYSQDATVAPNVITGRELDDLKAGKIFFGQDYAAQANRISDLFHICERGELRTASPIFNSLQKKIEDLVNSGHAFSLPDDISEKLSIPKRTYLPILRGLRPVNMSAENDPYLERTNKDYFLDTKGTLVYELTSQDVYTGASLYKLLSTHLLGKPEQRERIRRYENLLGKFFFGGQQVTLIPEYEKDTIAVQIGGFEQRPIFDLGDGLQQIIVVTSVVFLQDTPQMFFIEEPEQCLHPGLLRTLALFFLRETEHQYFITTHSNHLLDLTETNDSVTVHQVKKHVLPDGSSERFVIRDAANDREVLNELGVHPSSVYLANSTIWVEGITDRFYLGAFMQRYLHQMDDGALKIRYSGFMENFHYTFVEYQGGTLGHWVFDDADISSADDAGLSAIKLCAEAILICDGDIRTKGQGEFNRAVVLERQLGERLIVLAEKELENILPHEIIIRTALDVFSNRRIDKSSYDESKLNSIPAGYFLDPNEGIGYLLDKGLDENLPGKGSAEGTIRVFADTSGTIREKVEFCRKAVHIMNTTDWELNDPIKTLCEKIFAHIDRANPI
ncbi:AAA family ATPase [Undibacterium umbellatum]|uniref:ATP-binding protein n=1 Tax=Undibacterium umbellatum TaxID=2762300 RepID=A0ABR6ZI25_9BURK|nr:ATP-binding protein [Undibacterium umbellatum]MBC3911377.1 ATP-binding protein [Undibacterium umbellatum]